MHLLDPRFKYVPAVKTNVAETFARFGFRPTTEAERLARQIRHQQALTEQNPRREQDGALGRSH